MWGFTKFNFKLNLKVSAFYLEKQKSFIPKKNIFLAVPPRYIQKMACAVSIFQKVLVLASCKWFKIRAPGVGMRHMYVTAGLCFMSNTVKNSFSKYWEQQSRKILNLIQNLIQRLVKPQDKRTSRKNSKQPIKTKQTQVKLKLVSATLFSPSQQSTDQGYHNTGWFNSKISSRANLLICQQTNIQAKTKVLFSTQSTFQISFLFCQLIVIKKLCLW